MSLDRSVSTDKLNEDLWNAFGKEDTKGMRSLIEHGANPNSMPQKRQLLHKAAEDGKVEIVEVLLENGAKPNVKDIYQRTPLHFAAENGHTDVVRLLLEHKADVSATDMKGIDALILAANIEIVELLISNGIDIKSTDKNGQTALHIAASRGKFDIVKTLLKHGAVHSAKDNKRNTPILNAINNGHNDVVKALIDAGVNIRERVLFYGGDSTLLHHAVAAKNVEVVKTLLDHGYPVDAVDGGNWRAFDSACVSGQADIVELMLSRGANVNHVHGVMQTVPLHHTGPHYEVLEVLLKHKDINVNAQDRDGRTPIYHAAGKGFIGNFLLLLKYGAELNTENINKIDYNPLLVAFNESRQFHEQLKKQNEELVQLKKGLKEKDVLGEMYHREIARKEAEYLEKLKKQNEKFEKLNEKAKEKDNEQVKEKDSHIVKMIHKVNELKEKISELTSKLEKAEELIREKKQDEESKPTEKSIDDDITFELEHKNAVNANLSNELKSLKESNKLIDDDKSCTQLVHDNDCQFTLDDVSKLMVILQPVEDDWYQLGRHLDMEESTLRDIKQTDIPLEYLLQRWCSEGGTLMKLENTLTSLRKTDLISGLRQLKSVMKMDIGVQFNYMTPSIDSLDYLSEVHKAAKKLFIAEGDGHPQLLNWEKYGLRIGIPKGALMSSETTEIAVVALVGGQFKFPKRTQLVSTVYAISVSKPLVKPLRLDMQHCVDITKPSQINYLKFAIASVNTPSLPYQFEVVKGGEFTVNSFYGSIHRQTFSCFAIVAEEADILPVPFPDDPDPTFSTSEEEEDVPSGDDTNGQEEEGNGSTSSSNEEGNGCTNSDDESTQSNESQTHRASGSAMVNTSCENEEEVKTKPIQSSSQESTIDMSDCLSGRICYAGVIFHEDDDLFTFAATKRLNALLQYIKDEYPQAKKGQPIHFRFQPNSEYITLKFDAKQEDDCTGWIVKPHMKPCHLYQIDIDNFGTEEYPIPPSCLISVYSINRPDTVPVLHYGIPLKGVDHPVTIFIHRALRTTNAEALPSGAQPKLQPSTKDQLRSVVRQLRQVLDGNQVVLDNLFRQNIQSISRELRQVGILPNDPHQIHSYDTIITCFEIGLSFKNNKIEFEVYCNKFTSALANIGGPCTDAAEMITKEWKETLQQLQCIT